MQAPLADREVIGAGTSVETISSGAGGVNGSPGTTDPVEKRYQRDGWTIEEIAACDIPDRSNSVKDVAFCITDTRDPLDGTIRASDPIAVFARDRDGHELSLGEHFDGGAELVRTEDRAEGCEVRGFGVDARQDGQGAKIVMDRGGELRDLSIEGEGDGVGDWPCGIYVNVPRGEKVTLKNVNQPGGASRNGGVGSTHDSIGVLLNGESNGVLEMHGCTFGGFPNNGVYAEPWKHGNDGYAKIYDHTGYNSDRDQLRVGGRSIIENPTLYVDESKPGFDNHRGIWFKAANGARVTGGSIKTFPGSDSGSAIRVQSTSAAVEIEDIDIELRGTDYRARGVLAFSPDDRARRTGDVSVVIRNSRIHGDAPTRDGVLIKNRPGSKVVDTEIDLPNVDESNYVDIR